MVKASLGKKKKTKSLCNPTTNWNKSWAYNPRYAENLNRRITVQAGQSINV
jgi:hypothetical protein